MDKKKVETNVARLLKAHPGFTRYARTTRDGYPILYKGEGMSYEIWQITENMDQELPPPYGQGSVDRVDAPGGSPQSLEQVLDAYTKGNAKPPSTS